MAPPLIPNSAMLTLPLSRVPAALDWVNLHDRDTIGVDSVPVAWSCLGVLSHIAVYQCGGSSLRGIALQVLEDDVVRGITRLEQFVQGREGVLILLGRHYALLICLSSCFSSTFMPRQPRVRLLGPEHGGVRLNGQQCVQCVTPCTTVLLP